MARVHLTVSAARNLAELRQAIAERTAAAERGPCDVYLVATFRYHVGTPLLKAFEKVVRSVYLRDITPAAGNRVPEADADAKFERDRGRMVAYVRQRAVLLRRVVSGHSRPVLYPVAKARALVPGKPTNRTTVDQLVRQAVAFTRLY